MYGNHLFLGRLLRLAALIKKVSGRDAHNLRTAPRHEMPYRPQREGMWAARHDTTLPPPDRTSIPIPEHRGQQIRRLAFGQPHPRRQAQLAQQRRLFLCGRLLAPGASASTSRATPRCRA